MGHLAITNKPVNDKTLARMKWALSMWIADTRKQDVPLDNKINQEEPKNYKTIAKDNTLGNQDNKDPDGSQTTSEEPSMSALSAKFQVRWFYGSLKRLYLHSLSFHDEAGSAYHASVSHTQMLLLKKDACLNRYLTWMRQILMKKCFPELMKKEAK